jgi:hypothetical protein
MCGLGSIGTVLLPCLIGALLSGCTSISPSEHFSEAGTAPFRATGFSFPSPIGAIAITVTTAADPQLPQPPYSVDWAKPLGAVALAPIALLGGPFAGAILLGSGLVLASAAALYGMEMSGRSEYKALTLALTESNVPSMLADALRNRSMSLPPGDVPVGHAMVIVQGFGLVQTAVRHYCFVAAAELSVDQDNKELLNEALLLTLEPSADAPPIQCADGEKFSAENGRLVRETARDYAEVLAVMVTERLAKIR